MKKHMDSFGVCVLQDMELRASHTLGDHSTTELYLWPLITF